MFEFGRELRRLLSGARGVTPNQDGFTGGDAALLLNSTSAGMTGDAPLESGVAGR